MEISKSQYYRRYHIIVAENMRRALSAKTNTNYDSAIMASACAQSDYNKIGETLNPSALGGLLLGDDMMLSNIEHICNYFDIEIMDVLNNNFGDGEIKTYSESNYCSRLAANLKVYIENKVIDSKSNSLAELCEKGLIYDFIISPSPSDPKLQKSLLKKALEGKDLKLSSITRICDYFDIELELLLKP